ncbi:peptidylprolyl isomerase [Alkalihalobacillus sp. MEB130]|uniref:peptidylprolyl isomerase n=1 Tax=Alkalihalobacillus sp. MEB130 TaxID=2976704 RepID=UPI0028DF3EC6|nr:peptidylprolyl isomerase [Alkalihalobacillus sp. MEB130]MDT8860393.1 peptidylprolyl isomerase [Alkalihalobacillus sp. MEB130]
MRRKWMMIAFFACLLLVTGCGTAPEVEQEEEEVQVDEEESETGYTLDVEENPVVTITMENGDEIVVELYPDIAPNTVVNFVSLVEDGFYDGLTFHRVIPGFMVQGGDPNGDGSGGPDYSIEGEFEANGFENPLNHERGVISMARTNDPNSAGSQFFIMVEQSAQLDGQYAAFGKVLEGMEAVDEIVHSERDSRDKPLEEQRMASVTVDTKGYDYPDPVVSE